MKNILVFITFVSLNAVSEVPIALKEKLAFQEGDYHLVRGDGERCQGDVLDLAYEGDAQNSVLRLGQKFIFSHLETDSFKEGGGPDCEFLTKNEISLKSVVQVTHLNCKNKSREFTSTVALKFEKSMLRLNYERIGVGSRIQYKCEFSRQVGK